MMIGLGIAAAMALIQYVISRQSPKELAGDHGTMHPNDSMIAVAILIAWGVGCGALFYHLLVEHSVAAILIAFFLLVSIPIMATGFSPIYDLSWDTQKIEGPTTMWFPPFGPERREILFSDITDAGRDRWGNYFVQGADGTCIRWNWFYSGYPELMFFIEDICPHLFPDLDAAEA
ncbi:MAG: hypothetical protein LJE68_16740 [Rhodobacter sp.]|nr:hypothetical protein [Rhodobacter sp.]